jgi:hypothetical protein
MARVKANLCACDCKMKRLYTRAEGGKGWDGVGWMCTCGCGCICFDEGEWSMIGCSSDKCQPNEGSSIPQNEVDSKTQNGDGQNDCC